MRQTGDRLRAAVANALNDNAESEPRTLRQYVEAGLVAFQDDGDQFEPLIDRAVRAVLEALRDPTDEMEIAGYEAGCAVDAPGDLGNVGRLLGVIWPAMIDAALSKR